MSSVDRCEARPTRTAPTSIGRTSSTPTRSLEVLVNVVTAYQRIRLRLDARTLTIDTPVAWLGVVPHGRRIIEVPRHQIVDGAIAPAVFPSRLVVAVGLAALPWLATLPAGSAALCWIAATLVLLLSIVASIRIDTRDGQRHVIPFCWFEQQAVRSFLAHLGTGAP